jgi:hypothetical protein
MRRRRAERGEGNLGCIFWAAVLIVLVVVAWKIVPVKLKTAELYDFMVDQAGIATYTADPEVIKRRVLGKASELDLPLDKDHLRVERVGDNIRMSASYTVRVEFPGYTYDWAFNHEVNRPLYIF